MNNIDWTKHEDRSQKKVEEKKKSLQISSSKESKRKKTKINNIKTHKQQWNEV